MMELYVLDGKIPRVTTDMEEWGKCLGNIDRRRVAYTIVAVEPETVTVSTVFLGLDHNWLGKGEPLLFETMVFGGEHNECMDRYPTWEEAEAGHGLAVVTIEAKMATSNTGD